MKGLFKLSFFLKLISILLIIGLGVTGMYYLASKKKKAKKHNIQPVIRKVETLKLKPRNFTLFVSGNGLIKSQNELEVVSAVNGKIIYARNNLKSGTFVKKFQAIVQIDSSKAENNVHLARANLINSVVSLVSNLSPVSDKKIYLKWRKYLDHLKLTGTTPKLPKVISAREKIKVSVHNVYSNFYNVKNAEFTLSEHRIEAPFSGYITDSTLRKNSFIRAGQSLLKLIDGTRLEVSVPITLKEFTSLNLKSNPTVRIQSMDNPNRVLKGKVVRHDTQVKHGTQAIYVHVAFKNPSMLPEFFAGNYVSLSIKAKTLRNVMAVPRYLVRENKYIYTFEKGKLAQIAVKILAIKNGNVIIANRFKKHPEIVLTILQKPLLGMRLKKQIEK